MPTVSQRRWFDLQQLDTIREASEVKVKWPLLFLKAYAMVAAECPKLRQTYMSYPWPHLYQHDFSIANLVVMREFAGEEWLFFAPFHRPESTPLSELQSLLTRYKNAPIEAIFKTQYKLAHYPLFLRRFILWLRFHYSARNRVKRLGTFALTTVAGEGVTIVDPRVPVTTALTYGPLNDRGQCEVTVTFDHRVLDGLEVARILCRLEEILTTVIAAELGEQKGSGLFCRPAA